MPASFLLATLKPWQWNRSILGFPKSSKDLNFRYESRVSPGSSAAILVFEADQSVSSGRRRMDSSVEAVFEFRQESTSFDNT